MRFCVQLFSILLLTGISSLHNEPDCPNEDEMCANLEKRLDWNDLLDPDSECPASDYVDKIEPMICEHMDDLFLPEPPDVVFDQTPQDNAVGLGGSAEFDCVPNPEAHYIQWYFNGIRITAFDNPYSSVISFNGGRRNVPESETKLIVDPVDYQYYGQYTCRVLTSKGVATASAWLSNPNRNQSCAIEFTHEPKNRLVKVNEYVKLRCEATSHNSATLNWYKTMADGVRTEITAASSDAKVTRSGLIIPKPEHSATYTCEVSSSNSCKKESSAKITVYRKLSEVCGTNPKNAATLADIFRPKEEEDFANVNYGEDVKIGSIPWQGSMQSLQSGHFCGAVVVDRYWVLTAAHCFIASFNDHLDLSKNRHQHNTLLRFGIQDLYQLEGNTKYHNLHTREEQVRRIRRFVVHQRFRRKNLDYDLVLVKLTKPLEFDDDVRPVCLPIRSDNLFVEKSKPGDAGIVSGWGDGSKPILQGAKLTIRTEAICNMTDTDRGHTERMFCAGGGRIESAKACRGDSGGPFIIPLDDDLTKWYLAGIVSWGPPCTQRDESLDHQQGFYANVSVMASWILQTMGHRGVNWY